MSNRKKQTKEPLHLKISPLDSTYQFMNTYFQVMVWVQDDQEKMKTGGDDVPLSLSLTFEDNHTVEARPDLLEVDPDTPPVIKNGRASINVRITDVSMNEGNRKFCINIVPSPPSTISPARSDGILVITHRLQLEEGTPWEDEWFKDEGGRDKCITLRISLRDAKGNVVRGRKVPLTVKLIYNSGALVARQDILKIGPDSELCIQNGEAEIRARIDEVSRSHQNQPFKIMVGPQVDQHPLDNDVSPVVSLPVTVRSKRNNKNKKRKAEGAMSGASEAVRARTYAAEPMEPMTTIASPSSTVNFVRPPGAPSTTGTMQDALTNLLEWISEVLQVFQGIKWKPIGVEHIEGTPVGTRGVYEMKNPNADIDTVLTKYKHEVMDNLHLILSRLEPMLQESDAPASTPASNGRAEEPTDFSGVDFPPPSINRQVSSGYIDDGSTPGASHAAASMPFADIRFNGDTIAIERQIHYVIAKVFVHNDQKVGFPAFDENKNLLGFYRENEGGMTEIMFIPLKTVQQTISLSPENIRKGSESLDREIQRESQSVHVISQHGSLDKAKESALMYYWMKNSANDAATFTDLRDFFEL